MGSIENEKNCVQVKHISYRSHDENKKQSIITNKRWMKWEAEKETKVVWMEKCSV